MAIPATTYDIATITNPSGALTDFMFKVDLSTMSAGWWAGVNTSDGTRGRSSKGGGTTELATDWVGFDDTGETGWLFGKWAGTLASSGTQQVRIYPPNTANTAYGASDTYGSDNAYVTADEGNYPVIGDTASPLTDRTVNGEDGTWSDPQITIVSEKLDFDTGSGGHAGVALMSSRPLASATAFTIGGIFNLDDIPADRGIFYTNDHSSADPILIWFDFAGTNHVGVIINTTSTYSGVVYSGFVPSVSTDYHIVLTYDGSDLRLFIDGAEDTTGSFPLAIVDPLEAGAAGAYHWGADSSGGHQYNGTMQYMFIKSTSINGAWAAEDFLQKTDQATFWGTWTNVPVGGSSIPVIAMHLSRMRS